MSQSPERPGQGETEVALLPNDIEIVPVLDRKGLTAFIDVPYHIFKDDPNYRSRRH